MSARGRTEASRKHRNGSKSKEQENKLKEQGQKASKLQEYEPGRGKRQAKSEAKVNGDGAASEAWELHFGASVLSVHEATLGTLGRWPRMLFGCGEGGVFEAWELLFGAIELINGLESDVIKGAMRCRPHA